MKKNNLIPVILCGGTGSRLWPLSRAKFPKQYLSLISQSNKSLLQQTVERLETLENRENPIFICNEEHRFIVAEQIREINVKPKEIVLEPFARNTAPALAIAALKAIEDGSDPILLVLAADHVIKNNQQFLKTITAAKEYAEKGKLVAFGIVPSSPETGYGYIEAREPLEKNSLREIPILKFIEKPNLERAKQLICDRRYTWNSGMFLFKASILLQEIEKYEPSILKSCKKALKDNILDLDFQRLDKVAFDNCPNLSIDVAVMERTKKGVVLPLNVDWSDIGSWKSLWEISKKNNDGNVLLGKVKTKDSHDCYIRSENKLVVGLGLENLLIVDTRDALLVAEKSHDQDVKNIVKQLIDEESEEAITHKKVYRPWGNFTSVEEGSRWLVKKIEVKPGESLSLQMHHHRAEHWIVVTGTAEVEINEKRLLLEENKSIFIPLGAKHRLTNPGRIPLVLIEVQSGEFLSEEDIVRFDDVYGRTNE